VLALRIVDNVRFFLVHDFVLESQFLLALNQVINICLDVTLVDSSKVELVFDSKEIFVFT
jgi:hypothetical protein